MGTEKYLRPLGGPLRKRRVVVYDIESKEDDTQEGGFTRPFLVGLLTGKEFIAYRNAPEVASLPWQERHIAPGGCIDRMLRHIFAMDCPKPSRARMRLYQSKRCNIYAHNGGKFDHLFLVGWLMKHRKLLRFEIVSTQARIQRLDIWATGQSKRRGFWSFLDSVSLLPMTLDKIGKTFCPKTAQKMSQDFGAHEDDPSWEVYNRMDCVVLRKGLHAFHKLIESLGGEVGITAPATAMKLFRRKFMGDTWIQRNACLPDCDTQCKGCLRMTCDGACHGCAHAFVRLGYYGGRTELFAQYGYDVRYFDINSSYPASMLEDMPVGQMYVLGKSTEKHCALMARKCIGFVQCEVFVPHNCAMPPLPYRCPIRKKLLFPAGKFSGVWDWDELQLLKDVGGKILRIDRSVWYEKKPVFREMVEVLYQYRDKSRADYNEGLSYCAKLMLNSLYGKFGMREDRTALVLIPEGTEPPYEKGWPTNGDPTDCLIWEIENIASASYIVPQISAHITALSRIRLYRGMTGAAKSGAEILYVDTDSIMMEDGEIEESTKLGGWKREDPGILLEGYYVLPKLYRLIGHKPGCKRKHCAGCRGFSGKHEPECKDKACSGCLTSVEKMKGVGSKAQNASNWHSITNGGTISFPRVMQIRTMLAKNRLSPIVLKATKSLRTKYDKRILKRNGKTSPIILGDKSHESISKGRPLSKPRSNQGHGLRA
jgi:hypothetical protein